MRICTFLPSATEIVCALGLADELCGVTYECDYPPEARCKPVVIKSTLADQELTSFEIDRLVSEHFRQGKSTYLIDLQLLRNLKPDLIITQDLCQVCAVSSAQTSQAAAVLDLAPQVISLNPQNLDDILKDILRVGAATGRPREAERLVVGLRERIERISSKTVNLCDRPRVLCLEWLDPPYAGGHWVPEMVRIAGGQDGIGREGEPSFRISWEKIRDYAPQVIVLMPCGFNIKRTLQEIEILCSHKGWAELPAVASGKVFAVDASSYFSRPGPRIVRGIEILASIIHPDLFPFKFEPDVAVNLSQDI